jgi:isocitrate/isopropylmalate dehydrogenase
MSQPTIAWLAADSAAYQLLDMAHAVLNQLKPGLNYLTGDIGWDTYQREGNALPDRTLELVRRADCTLLIVTTGGQTPHTSPNNKPNIPKTTQPSPYLDPWKLIAWKLYLPAELRPCRMIPGNPLNKTDSMDIAIFRDALEGSGTGIGFHPLTPKILEILTSHPKGKYLSLFPLPEIALNSRIITRQGFERVLVQAFEFARRNRRHNVTIVDQPELFPQNADLIMQTARDVALDYPAMPYRELPFFTVLEDLFHRPQDYDVIVTENLLGEVLSRLAAEMVGGIGFLCRVAIGDEHLLVGPVPQCPGDPSSSCQPSPFSTLLAVRMLLEFLGDAQTASILGKAIDYVVADPEIATPQFGGTATVSEVGNAVALKAKLYLDLL